MGKHKTIKIRDKYGDLIPIDEKIADLVSILWDRNYSTDNSCQDNFVYSRRWQTKKHFVWIEFSTPVDATRFIKEYIGEDVNRYYEVIETWENTMTVENINTEYYPDEDAFEDKLPFKFVFGISIRFPTNQLKHVKARFNELSNMK